MIPRSPTRESWVYRLMQQRGTWREGTDLHGGLYGDSQTQPIRRGCKHSGSVSRALGRYDQHAAMQQSP